MITHLSRQDNVITRGFLVSENMQPKTTNEKVSEYFERVLNGADLPGSGLSKQLLTEHVRDFKGDNSNGYRADDTLDLVARHLMANYVTKAKTEPVIPAAVLDPRDSSLLLNTVIGADNIKQVCKRIFDARHSGGPFLDNFVKVSKDHDHSVLMVPLRAGELDANLGGPGTHWSLLVFLYTRGDCTSTAFYMDSINPGGNAKHIHSMLTAMKPWTGIKDVSTASFEKKLTLTNGPECGIYMLAFVSIVLDELLGKKNKGSDALFWLMEYIRTNLGQDMIDERKKTLVGETTTWFTNLLSTLPDTNKDTPNMLAEQFMLKQTSFVAKVGLYALLKHPKWREIIGMHKFPDDNWKTLAITVGYEGWTDAFVCGALARWFASNRDPSPNDEWQYVFLTVGMAAVCQQIDTGRDRPLMKWATRTLQEMYVTWQEDKTPQLRLVAENFAREDASLGQVFNTLLVSAKLAPPKTSDTPSTAGQPKSTGRRKIPLSPSVPTGPRQEPHKPLPTVLVPVPPRNPVPNLSPGPSPPVPVHESPPTTTPAPASTPPATPATPAVPAAAAPAAPRASPPAAPMAPARAPAVLSDAWSVAQAEHMRGPLEAYEARADASVTWVDRERDGLVRGAAGTLWTHYLALTAYERDLHEAYRAARRADARQRWLATHT